jgi:replicative DNA helicase
MDLVDPDASKDVHFNWEEDFQRHVISLILLDKQFMLEAMDLVKPHYFTNKAHQTACSIAFDFFKRYGILPEKVFLVQEFKDRLKGNKSLPYLLGEINVVFDFFQAGMESREYLAKKIEYFAKIMAVRNTFSETVKLMQKEPESEETWGKIHEMWRKAMLVERNFDIGIDYFKSLRDRLSDAEDEADQAHRFKTGWVSVDEEVGGGFSTGEVIAVVAPSGVGKSLSLACLCAINLMRMKKGVYISCELKDKKVARRMDAILTGLNVKTLNAEKEDVFSRIEELRSGNQVIKKAGDKQWFENSVGGSSVSIAPDEDFSPFIIKQFPARSASVNTLRAYLSQLIFRGFKPDFVIVDYVGEMKDIPGMETHQSRAQIISELRGMAEEYDVFIAIALQPNRSGKEESKNKHGKIDDTHFADSFAQIMPLDGAIALMQNDMEKQMGVGRGYVIKLRDGKSRFDFYLSFDQENLRITEIHKETYKGIMVKSQETIVDELETDKIKDIDQQMAEDAEKKAKEAIKKKQRDREKKS